MFRITTLSNFSYMEEGADKGASIREKSHLIADLLTIPSKLEEERQTARQYREKFYSKPGGISSDSYSNSSKLMHKLSLGYAGGGGNSYSTSNGYGGYG